MTDSKGNIEASKFIDKNGKILESKLFQFLYPSSVDMCSKSVVTPLAQTTSLCDSHKTVKAELNWLHITIDKILKEEPILGFIIEILFNGSCRISEVLNIKPNDYKSNGQVFIKGSKGSNNKLVSIYHARQYLEKCKKNLVYPFKDYNRFYVYRRLKFYNIGRQFQGKNKASITHYFRHLSLRILELEEVEKNDRIRQSGHKSSKSLSYYERNKIQ